MKNSYKRSSDDKIEFNEVNGNCEVNENGKIHSNGLIDNQKRNLGGQLKENFITRERSSKKFRDRDKNINYNKVKRVEASNRRKKKHLVSKNFIKKKRIKQMFLQHLGPFKIKGQREMFLQHLGHFRIKGESMSPV